MKRLIAIIACAAVALVAVGAFLSEYRFGYPYRQAFADAYTEEFRSADDSDWETVTQEEVTLTNGSMTLTMDTATTHFTVADAATGQRFSSYPEEELNPVTTEDGIRLKSNVALQYHTEKDEIKYMSAYVDSVQSGTYRIVRQDNVLRVYYTMGFDPESIFLPMVFTEEVFEQRIKANLNGSQNRQLAKHYALYSPENKGDDFADKVKDYPALEHQALYIYTSSYDMVTVKSVASLMQKAGYTAEEYESDTADLEVESSGLMPAGFVIPLELELTETGLSARVLMDRVETSNESDQLVEIYLLEFFGAAEQNEGYFLVPDGSGARIDLDAAVASDYIQSLYAPNPAIPDEQQAQLTQLAHLPLFGYADGKASGYAALVSGARASCELTARVKNNVNVVSNIYAGFTVCDNEESTIGADRGLPVDYMYARRWLTENPEINYVFLRDTFDSDEIAAVYRETLGDAHAEEADAPVYLDFLCSARVNKSLLGIPYEKRETLSTLSEIREVVVRLQEAGITNLRVRLSGLAGSGVQNSAVTDLKWDKKLGTREDFQALKETLAAAGGRLIIDLPIALVYRERVFDAYPVNTFTARRLNDTMAATHAYDLVSLKYQESDEAYVVSPGVYLDTAQRLIECYEQDDLFDGVGFSWSDAGSILPADYSKKSFYDRNMTVRMMQQSMTALAEASGSLMLDRGADYMLPYAGDMVNVPLYSSGYLCETRDHPLYAMILKGRCSFAGSALNLSSDYARDLAASAAVGAGQYYLFITRDDALLQKAGLGEEYYSLHTSHTIDRLIADYAAYNAVFRQTAGSGIRSADYLDSGILQVVYDNGVTVTANLSAADYTGDGLTLARGAYTVIG